MVGGGFVLVAQICLKRSAGSMCLIEVSTTFLPLPSGSYKVHSTGHVSIYFPLLK
jgi:hypothetical protein